MQKHARSRFGGLLIATALLLTGCSGSYSDDVPDTTPQAFIDAPVETPTPEATAKPAAEPKPLPVKVSKRTSSVRRNKTASVTIKTIKGSRCSIDVEYASGSATAKGLDAKKANSSGVITWKWKVGSNTTRGTWPIEIYCTLGERAGSVSTQFKVT
jgi:hypothetical protein